MNQNIEVNKNKRKRESTVKNNIGKKNKKIKREIPENEDIRKRKRYTYETTLRKQVILKHKLSNEEIRTLDTISESCFTMIYKINTKSYKLPTSLILLNYTSLTFKQAQELDLNNKGLDIHMTWTAIKFGLSFEQIKNPKFTCNSIVMMNKEKISYETALKLNQDYHRLASIFGLNISQILNPRFNLNSYNFLLQKCGPEPMKCNEFNYDLKIRKKVIENFYSESLKLGNSNISTLKDMGIFAVAISRSPETLIKQINQYQNFPLKDIGNETINLCEDLNVKI